MHSFLHGFILSLGLILPLGVQNLFVFNQGATQPRYLRALPAAITASICDTLLIVLAVQGISLLLLTLSLLKLILISTGSLFLFYMGFLTWRNTPLQNSQKQKQDFSAKQQIGFAVTVSLLNLHAVLDTVGVIGTSSINYQGQEKVMFILACITVSWLWFLLLSAAGHILRNQQWFAKIGNGMNKVSAIFIWGSALYMLSLTR